nr:hypothetical protein L204_05356 [Cryptococcus depauperatus CBS 7855]
MLLLAVVDDRRRFVYVQDGDSARASDMRAQQAKRLLASCKSPCDGRTSHWNPQSTAWHPPFSQYAHVPRHEHRLHPAQPASQELEAVVDVNDLQDIMHEKREVRAERLRHEDCFQQFPEQYRRLQVIPRPDNSTTLTTPQRWPGQLASIFTSFQGRYDDRQPRTCHTTAAVRELIKALPGEGYIAEKLDSKSDDEKRTIVLRKALVVLDTLQTVF